MAEQLANNAQSTLSAGIDNIVTSLTVANGTVFPALGNFRIIIDSEIIIVGARSGNTLSSLARGAEGTTAASHSSAALVTHVLTKAGLDQYLTDKGYVAATIVDAKGDLIVATAADVVARLAVGANDLPLIGDSAQASGLKWGYPVALPRVYDRATTTVDVQTSIAETSIYSKSIAANDMGMNRMLRLTLLGDYLHNNVAGDTLTFRVKFGGTTFYANPGTLGAVLGAARHPWQLTLCVANLGATNSQMIEGQLGPVEDPNQNAPTTGIGQALSSAGAQQRVAGLGISTLAAIDTTVAQTLDITVQWSASSANNSWRTRYAVLELV